MRLLLTSRAKKPESSLSSSARNTKLSALTPEPQQGLSINWLVTSWKSTSRTQHSSSSTLSSWVPYPNSIDLSLESQRGKKHQYILDLNSLLTIKNLPTPTQSWTTHSFRRSFSNSKSRLRKRETMKLWDMTLSLSRLLSMDCHRKLFDEFKELPAGVSVSIVLSCYSQTTKTFKKSFSSQPWNLKSPQKKCNVSRNSRSKKSNNNKSDIYIIRIEIQYSSTLFYWRYLKNLI